ncbi:MAG: molybdopterin-binding protein [Mesorhizobium sp.]|nr:molybdopterin-binding protein [Mesorhizobium sp.]MBN9245546.1 molybdopterin-binding protein [Mesorhizobium sp.]
MSKTPQFRGALTSVELLLADLLDSVAPIEPFSAPVDEAMGYIAAEMPLLAAPLPARNQAVIDGWALSSLDIAGASPYSPVPLNQPPHWVETGEAMPDGCDCVLMPDLVERHGPLAQALAEAIPGQGVRRAGEEIAASRPLLLAGRKICVADTLALLAAGRDTAMIRAPALTLIDVAPSGGGSLTADLIAALAHEAGARVTVETVGRDGQMIAEPLARATGDLIVVVGGTGAGRTDHTAAALDEAGTLIAHRLALQPGVTTAIARCGGVPVVALPGLPGHAFAAYFVLVQPLIDRLSCRLPRQGMTLPLSRKIASTVGVTEIALLRREAEVWHLLAVGDFSLDHLRMADAWLAVGSGSEGFAAGTRVEAFPLRAP